MARNGTAFSFALGTKSTRADVLLVPLAIQPAPAMSAVNAVDTLCDGAVSELLTVKAVGKDVGHLSQTTRSSGYRRVVVISLGKAEALTAHDVRKAAASAARWLITERVGRAALWIDGLTACGLDEPVAEWTAGMTLAGWQYAERKERKRDALDSVRVTLHTRNSGHGKRVQAEVREMAALCDAVNYARHLAHQPSNVIHPRTLANEARKLARSTPRLKCTVLEGPALRKLKMEGLLAVGRAGTTPPCLILLDYKPVPRSRANTVLVGKAITFDTGGYSIKTAGMESMKFDKCGGTTVLGIMKAVADLRLTCNVTGVIAAAENSITGDAYKPGDILTMASGKSVEITNTDAEGRIVLADALWYAQEKLKPTRILDYATLTGGVLVALGTACAGMMCNDDRLADELEECGRATHERLWRLPLWDDYRELIKSPDADIKNSASVRHAHPIVGGIFLKEFVSDKIPWAHLDIAGTAATENGDPVFSKGATGFGVRMTVEYLRRYAS